MQQHQNNEALRLRVLIVDEHEIFGSACAALLATEGFDAIKASPGADLLDLTHGQTPDVVLIDATSGQGLLATVAALSRRRHAPAIVVMSSANVERLDPGLSTLPFIPKADICAETIRRAVAASRDQSPSASESR
jgi:DNA-binding NtrC family response regulator